MRLLWRKQKLATYQLAKEAEARISAIHLEMVRNDLSVTSYLWVAFLIRVIRRKSEIGPLPAPAPAKCGLAINLETARALGLDLPSSLLATADEEMEWRWSVPGKSPFRR